MHLGLRRRRDEGKFESGTSVAAPREGGGRRLGRGQDVFINCDYRGGGV